MKKIILASLVAIPLICQSSYAAEVKKDEKKIGETKYGRPIFDIRYLHESVNQKGIGKQGDANTVRTRVGYETAKFNDLSALIEFENVKRIGGEAYNDSTNGKAQYPTTPDPNSNVLNRLYVNYSGIDKTNITAGRQAISLDNQRFVGGIAWRQNDQTMDAIAVKTKLIKNSEIFYAHANQVNRVFGNQSKVGTWNNNNIDLMNVAVTPIEQVKVIGYSYLLDIPDNTASSSATYGLRTEAKHKFSDRLSSAVNLEYAYQRGYAGSPNNNVFNYFMAEPSLTCGQWTVKGMYESIQGNGSTTMQFGLGTNHAFNGWVDKFYVATSPANGLIDSNATLQYAFKSDMNWLNGAKTFIRYHKFRAENKTRNMDYGSEVDYFFEKSFKNNFTVGVQAGKYRAKSLYTNTVKIMPYMSYKF